MWTTEAQTQEEDEVGEDEGPSSISLRINTSVNVSKSNNIICLDATPADHANSIAQAVVQAIHKHSSAECGIPMIDEQGRPRPVNIEVDASMMVEGSGNIIGGQEAILRVLAERSQQQRLMRVRQREDDESPFGAEAEGSQMPAKRRRSRWEVANHRIDDSIALMNGFLSSGFHPRDGVQQEETWLVMKTQVTICGRWEQERYTAHFGVMLPRFYRSLEASTDDIDKVIYDKFLSTVSHCHVRFTTLNLAGVLLSPSPMAPNGSTSSTQRAKTHDPRMPNLGPGSYPDPAD
jgi:hypothetical protein